MLINPELTAKSPAGRTALLQLGFRPFFLLAGLSASLPLLYWSHVYASGDETLAYPPATWHGHEMVFGYVVAVVAGILLTAGMMVRVSMGHSGRSLHAPDSLVLAFMLLNIAAITRVFVPLAWPALYQDTVIVSAWLWAIAFAIFVIRMAPVYWLPRVDGRPG